MASSSLPLYPTDDGWPYPDVTRFEPLDEDDIDLDVLELRADPHAYAGLTPSEYFAVAHRYGIACEPCSMKELARALDCTHAEAAVVLGAAIDKLRTRLSSP